MSYWWFGPSIDGFDRKSGKHIVHIREWRGWPEDLDVPLALRTAR